MKTRYRRTAIPRFIFSNTINSPVAGPAFSLPDSLAAKNLGGTGALIRSQFPYFAKVNSANRISDLGALGRDKPSLAGHGAAGPGLGREKAELQLLPD